MQFEGWDIAIGKNASLECVSLWIQSLALQKRKLGPQGCDLVVEYRPSTHKAQGSIPSAAQKNSSDLKCFLNKEKVLVSSNFLTELNIYIYKIPGFVYQK